MNKTTSPALPLYGGAWMKSTAHIPADVRGYYLDLLLWAWDNDADLPADERSQMQIARCTSRPAWKKAWAILRPLWMVVESGGFRNRKLESVRDDLLSYRWGKSEAGKKGAEKRWQHHGKRDGKANSKAIAESLTAASANGWPSSSSSSSNGSVNQDEDLKTGSSALQVSAEPASPDVLAFATVGAPREWTLTEAQVSEWAEAFPNLDIFAEAIKAKAWVNASPERRKTAKGMPRFLVGWFSRSVNSGHTKGHGSKPTAAVQRALGPAYRGGSECPHDPTCNSKQWCLAQQERDRQKAAGE